MSVAETLDPLFPNGLSNTLLISLGNSLRKDDGVGPYLAMQLAKISGVKIENAGDRPERSIDFAESHRPEQIVFLDAADFGCKPGTLRQIETSELVERSLSSHRLPLSALIDWIEAEYSICCFCLGIQAGSMQLGEELTPEVTQTAEHMIRWFKYAARKEVK